MKDSDKTDFCRALATLRAMYPNEYNMSELVPVAYWVACRDTSLAAVKEAMARLIRSPDWLRQMPSAPVLAEQARIVERQKLVAAGARSCSEELRRPMTSREIAWAEDSKDLTELHIRNGLDRGAATLRAVRELLAKV